MRKRFLVVSLLSYFSIPLIAQAYIRDAEKDYIKHTQIKTDVLIPETSEENRSRGFNALYRRMKWNKIKELGTEEDSDSIKYEDSFFFYFKPDQEEFIDNIQVKQVSGIIEKLTKNPALSAKVMGAADSMTGNEADNRLLAIRRARKILQYIKDAGIIKSRLSAYSLGGIDMFPQKEENRLVCVILYRK